MILPKNSESVAVAFSAVSTSAAAGLVHERLEKEQLLFSLILEVRGLSQNVGMTSPGCDFAEGGFGFQE